jgi:hypothetical protein
LFLFLDTSVDNAVLLILSVFITTGVELFALLFLVAVFLAAVFLAVLVVLGMFICFLNGL